LNKYYLQLISALLIICGSFLMLEHLFMWGGFDPMDIIGHETYGLIFIITAYIIGLYIKNI